MWDLDHKTGWMPKNWASELWCLIIFLRGPYTTRGSNQSIWKEINFWPLLSQLRHLLRASRWKEWMLPLQKCLTMAAPSKEFVAPEEEAQKGWRLCVPWAPWYNTAFSPASLKAKEGAFWTLEEGNGPEIHWGHHLPSMTGKDRAGIYGRELVTGVLSQKGTSSVWSTSPKLPWRRSPVISTSEMGQRVSISLPLRIPLNEEVVELVGHHKHSHGLDHPPVAILGAASPKLQSWSSGGNWESCVSSGSGPMTM